MNSKLLYKPVGIAVGMAAGMAAGAVFNQVWKVVGGDSEAPEPLDEARSWSEVLPAAALQGAVFALVRAAVNRGGATAVRRVTGTWPG